MANQDGNAVEEKNVRTAGIACSISPRVRRRQSPISPPPPGSRSDQPQGEPQTEDMVQAADSTTPLQKECAIA